MTRQGLSDYLTKIIWFAVDGLLRSGGIVVDPQTPLSLEPSPPLRLVAPKTQGETGDDRRARG